MSIKSSVAAMFVAVAAITACHSSVPVMTPYAPVTKAACPQPPMEPDPEPVVVTLHADVDFTPAERAAMEAAAQHWRDQTHGLADIRFVYDLSFASMDSLRANLHNHIVARFDHDSDLIQKLDCFHATAQEIPCGTDRGPKVLGFVSPPGGVNADEPMRIGFVWDRVGDKDKFQGVALHELGHVLGIGHLENKPKSVMYPAYNNSKQCLRKDDLDAFCKVQDCGSVHMSPCE
jgi:hypothetical protein